MRVVIIGAGPAGSTAAYHLARSGVDVTVIESRTFPRAKVCGEYISPAAVEILEQVVPAAELIRAGGRRVSKIAIEVGTRHAEWDAPRQGWSLSRSTLDCLLLEKAREMGAAAVVPASVRRVAYSDTEVRVELSAGRVIQCDLVVHADGCGRHDISGPVPVAPNLLAHKCHLRVPEADPDAVTMRSCPGAYVGLIRIEGDLWTCAMVSRRSRTREYAGDIDALLGNLWPAYRPAWRASKWKSCGVARSKYIAPGHPRSLRIGNAAAAVDPVGGEGIGLALWAGSLLGQFGGKLVATNSLNTDAQLRELRGIERAIGSAYRARLRTRLQACQAAAWMLMRPAVVKACWPTARIPALSFRPWYRLTGKPGIKTANNITR